MEKDKVKIVEWEFMGGPCPTQAFAKSKDGVQYYIRYRHGMFMVVNLGKDGKAYDIVFTEFVGGALDGDMSEEQMKKRAQKVLDFSEVAGV